MPPANADETEGKTTSDLSLEVMRKGTSTKKGLACRFSCKFFHGSDTLLLYIAEDSYVIDLDDMIDKNEILKMIRNSYSKFKETFDVRKLGTILQNRSLIPLNEAGIDVDAILPLLN